MPLTAKNLLWTKNIIRDGGQTWAYMGAEHADEFVLQFSPGFAGGAANAQVGDVILLFQKMRIPGFKRLYLTHLVTPVNKQVVPDPEEQYPVGRLVKVIARPQMTSLIAKPADLNFFLPNRGGCCPLNLITGLGRVPIDKPILQGRIWDLFDGHFHSTNNQ